MPFLISIHSCTGLQMLVSTVKTQTFRYFQVYPEGSYPLASFPLQQQHDKTIKGKRSKQRCVNKKKAERRSGTSARDSEKKPHKRRQSPKKAAERQRLRSRSRPWEERRRRTCAEVSLRQGLQDGVHGPHVEDEAELGHTHGDEAQQEDGTEDALHEGLACKGKKGGKKSVVVFWIRADLTSCRLQI